MTAMRAMRGGDLSKNTLASILDEPFCRDAKLAGATVRADFGASFSEDSFVLRTGTNRINAMPKSGIVRSNLVIVAGDMEHSSDAAETVSTEGRAPVSCILIWPRSQRNGLATARARESESHSRIGEGDRLVLPKLLELVANGKNAS